MKIEEAILFVLTRRNGGMKTDQIAEVINRERLYVCKDGRPVSSAFVFRTIKSHPETFCLAEGRVFLMI